MIRNDEDLHRQLAVGILCLSPVVVLLLTVTKTPTYGKLYQPANPLFGPLLSARVCWFFFEIPNLLWVIHACWTRNKEIFGVPNKILLVLFTIHYLNRAILYPLLVSTNSKFPLGLIFFTVLYTTVNGFLQAHGLCQLQSYPHDYEYSPRFLIGITLMVVGFSITYVSDQVLIALKKQNKGYQIPRGGLFEYVSGPHFFGECVEWMGYAIAYNGLSGWSFSVWTACNLLPRALAQQKWYAQKFEDYPLERLTMIPFLL
jgi:3-oxo-5-alpha-steroid 4-dehydrogenase 1